MSKIDWKTVKQYDDITYKKRTESQGSPSTGPMFVTLLDQKPLRNYWMPLKMRMKIHPSGSFYSQLKGRPAKMENGLFVAAVTRKQEGTRDMWERMATIG